MSTTFSDHELLNISRLCAEKLEANADRSGGPDACWEWTKSTICGFGKDTQSQKGYGQIGGSFAPLADGTKRRWHRLTHRAAMEVKLGRMLAPAECVLHSCDNPPCCNPAHLFLGTRADNCDDKMAKGRHNYKTHYGTKHGMSKMTDDKVREMRELYATKQATQNQLAARYGITQATVWSILNRKTWAHVA